MTKLNKNILVYFALVHILVCSTTSRHNSFIIFRFFLFILVLVLVLVVKVHRVPQKTCDYIFYNNFNNKCQITIIFGIVSSKSMRHRKMVSFPTSPI